MGEPEFTDTARAALLWVLWHHQGGSSPTGQAVRFALGMGQFDRMTADQVAQAKAWAPGIPGLAHTDPPGVTTAQAPSRYACPYCDQREGEPHGAFCRGAGTMVKRPAGGVACCWSGAVEVEEQGEAAEVRRDRRAV